MKKKIRYLSKCEDGGEDRISSLPDHVLVRKILSKIPIRDAVRTCILSSRWRYLWTSFTYLNLAKRTKERRKKFEGFASHVLQHCKLVKEVSLVYRVKKRFKDLSVVNELISSAVDRKPKVLYLTLAAKDIDFSKIVLSSYPTCNITYNTLVYLKLKLFFKVNIPDSLASFPCLKVLHFTGWFPYENHCSALDRLISRSPVLEVFKLVGFLDSKMEFLESKTNFEFDICIPTLKILELHLKTDVQRVHPHTVTIDASKLPVLHILDKTSAKYIMKNVGSLEFVELNYGTAWFDNPEVGLEHISRLRSLLFGIAMTKKLAISADSLVNLELLVSRLVLPWPQFSHLTTLELRACEFHDWTLLPHFLKNSPKLESLRLNKELYGKVHPWDNGDDLYAWSPPYNIPECLKLTLKYVSISSFEGRKDELQLAEYFLRNAQVLQVMMITTDPYPVKDEMKEKLLMFDTASKTCQVHVYKEEESKLLIHRELDLQVKRFINTLFIH